MMRSAATGSLSKRFICLRVGSRASLRVAEARSWTEARPASESASFVRPAMIEVTLVQSSFQGLCLAHFRLASLCVKDKIKGLIVLVEFSMERDYSVEFFGM